MSRLHIHFHAPAVGSTEPMVGRAVLDCGVSSQEADCPRLHQSLPVPPCQEVSTHPVSP